MDITASVWHDGDRRGGNSKLPALSARSKFNSCECGLGVENNRVGLADVDHLNISGGSPRHRGCVRYRVLDEPAFAGNFLIINWTIVRAAYLAVGARTASEY